MSARVVLHLPDAHHRAYDGVPRLALYPRVRDVVQGLGGTVVVAGRPRALFENAELPGDGDLHIVEGGRVRGEGWLCAALAYLPGYWHLDPVGVLSESSIGARVFDARLVPEAQTFFDALRQRFVVPRVSRYNQRVQVEPVPEGAIAVFLQGPAPFRRGLAHMTSEAMVRCVVEGAGGRVVVVKPHPLARAEGQAKIAALQAEGCRVQATGANVHDILAACAVTVSVNSAASVEGFLHGKPAILFGRSDLAQFAQTVRAPAEFDSALARALDGDIPYAQVVAWYFGQHCLWLDAPDFGHRMLRVFAQAGFGADRLGLRDE